VSEKNIVRQNIGTNSVPRIQFALFANALLERLLEQRKPMLFGYASRMD
jgi:hypothetical protein